MEMKNSILQQAEDKIESQITDQKVKEDYMKIVVAGMNVALHGGPNSMVAALRHSKNPLESCAKGSLGLVFGMKKMAKGTMPTKALVPAAMTLMLKGLDFANSAGIVKVGNDELVQATKIFTDTIMRIYHITPQMIHHALGKVNSLMSNPDAVEKMKMAAGFTQHPDAAKPTSMPGA